MLRLVAFLVAVAAAASGLSWLADRPGSLVINWQGYEIETSVFRAIVMLALLVGLSILSWSIITSLWRSPASVGAFFNRRRQVRGLEALSSGMIAIGSGDQANATRFAVQARKALPNEPLTQLLRAQAAQLTGDRSTARRMFESMLATPETEQLGLRGLFLEAEREGEREVARHLAERSVQLNPKLGWAVDSLFELQCKDKDWAAALGTLAVAKRHQHHDKIVLDRRRAVLLTARAQELEETEPDRAMALAVEAHHLAHDLIPAAAIAGRMLAARGHTKRAAKIIERTWRFAPHPDLSLAYAHARVGDSPRDRFDRIKRLGQLNPHSIESPLAIAAAAIEAKDWETARRSLEHLDAGRMTQRVCMLMARIDGEAQGDKGGDKGRVREWLARAVHAPRDPAWVADGVVAERWAPVSPVTGAFDVFQWRVPADALDAADTDLLARKLDELMQLGAPAPGTSPGLGSELGSAEDVPVDMPPRPRNPADPSDHGRDKARRYRDKPLRDAEDLDPVTVRPTQASRSPISEVRDTTRGGATANGRIAAVDVIVDPSTAKVAPAKSPVAIDRADKPAMDSVRKPLEPSMFIAPSASDETTVTTSPSASDAKDTPRVVAAGGQRRA